MPLPIVLAIVLGVAVEMVGFSLGWSNGAIGSVCLVIIAIAVVWNEELRHRRHTPERR